MWKLFLLVFSVAFCLWKLFKSVIKPYTLYRYYKKQLTAKNYRLHADTFMPYMAPSIIQTLRDEKDKKDGYYLAKYEGPKYDVVLTNIAERIVLVLISPKLIQQFYMLDGTKTYIKQKQFLTSIKRAAQNSITFAQGEVWKVKRRFMTNFFNFNYINKQFSTMVNIVNRKLEEAAKDRNQFDINLLELLQQMTSATIIQLFFGGGSTDAQNLQIQGQKISSYMRVLVQHLGEQTLDPLSFMFGQGFPLLNLRAKDRLVTHEVKIFRQFTTNFIKNRIYEIKEGKSKKQDFVQKVYESVKQQERTPLFIKKIMFDFGSLYIAGTDTTSHSALMVIYQILLNPESKQKMLQEINRFIKADEDINYEKVKDMIYLDCVIHECLRLYQPANGIFIREATEDHMLDDIKILKGTLIMVSSLSNHYNKQNFENPLQFKPQRWITEQGTLKVPKPFTWLTFSAGARSCIGKQLALSQLKIIVIQMFRKYNMTMQTTDLIMKMHNFSYQPQKLMTKFVKKGEFIL